jgi:hypothetical protein
MLGWGYLLCLLLLSEFVTVAARFCWWALEERPVVEYVNSWCVVKCWLCSIGHVERRLVKVLQLCMRVHVVGCCVQTVYETQVDNKW